MLIERAAPAVRRWARGRLPAYARQDANTEDVVQDAVMRTWRNIPHFHSRTAAGIQAYLRVSVVNRIRELIRRARRRGIAVEVSDDLRDDQPSPIERLIKGERLERFLNALQTLTPNDRQIIIWRFEFEYSHAEIAERLGKSKPAAGMALSRAMARLARTMQLQNGVSRSASPASDQSAPLAAPAAARRPSPSTP